MAAPICRRHCMSLQRFFSKIFRSSADIQQRSLYSSRKQYEDQKTETHFGYEYIPEEEKEERVYKVFENVATKYDLMNDAMSVGIHRLWKDHFMRKMAPVEGTQLIDVAGGTGDIAFRFLQYIQNEDNINTDYDLQLSPEFQNITEGNDPSSKLKNSSHVTVCDINQAMLDVGQSKAEKLGFLSDTTFVQGNAEMLPMESNKFDVYTIAYGIRNCTHIDKVLEEAYKVLKPGGRFMCLEFSHVTNSLLQQLYDSYSFQVIPVMGQVLANDWKSYQYLVESIRQFPNQVEFSRMLRSAGFKMVNYENLTFGVSAIHSGFKL